MNITWEQINHSYSRAKPWSYNLRLNNNKIKQVTLLKGPTGIWFWFGMVRFGLELFGTWVMSRCFYVGNFKLWAWKTNSYWQFNDIWFGLVWLDLVWFGFEWFGTWVIYRCFYMQNFELLAWKTTELWMI